MFIELENYFLKILDYCLLITLINRLNKYFYKQSVNNFNVHFYQFFFGFQLKGDFFNMRIVVSLVFSLYFLILEATNPGLWYKL